VVVIGRLVGLLRLLRHQMHSPFLMGLDANGIVIDETGMFSRVIVGKIERVAGELDAT
jgi:hypothetical protein